MSQASEEAKKLLEAATVIHQLPFAFHDVEPSNEAAAVGAVVGAMRDAKGRNLVQPHAESASMIVSFPATVKLLIEAPRLLQELVNEVEGAESA